MVLVNELRFSINKYTVQELQDLLYQTIGCVLATIPNVPTCIHTILHNLDHGIQDWGTLNNIVLLWCYSGNTTAIVFAHPSQLAARE